MRDYWIYIFAMMYVFNHGTCKWLDEMDSSDVIAVKTRLEDEKSQRLLMKNDVEMLMLKVAKLEREKQDMPARNRETTTSTVAFSARLTRQVTLATGKTLVFDHVITNTGSAYDSTSGVFRAPVSGTYVFTVSILCQHKKFAEVNIMKDNVRIASVLAAATVHGWHDQGSVTVTLGLTVNEDVHVDGHLGESFIYHDYYTVFTGFLLKEHC